MEPAVSKLAKNSIVHICTVAIMVLIFLLDCLLVAVQTGINLVYTSIPAYDTPIAMRREEEEKERKRNEEEAKKVKEKEEKY